MAQSVKSTGVDLERERKVDTDTVPNPVERSAANEWEAVDDTFDLLSNHRRRRVLGYVGDSSSTTVGELAERIASIENEKPRSALSSQERKRVYIALYQSHLPKMAEAGVVTYDKDRGTVSSTEKTAELRALLEERGPARRWSGYYLLHMGATVIGLILGAVVLGATAWFIAVVALGIYVVLTVTHATIEYGGTNTGVVLDPRKRW